MPDAVDIAAQAASALAAAHAHGIVHRDLKPENLFLMPDPSQRSHVRVKVLDFGIAKLQRRLSGQSIRTHTGSIMGTPPYMSPEQCRGISSEIDQRTDVYAMGIILYEMLTGDAAVPQRGVRRRPADAPDPAAAAAAGDRAIGPARRWNSWCCRRWRRSRSAAWPAWTSCCAGCWDRRPARRCARARTPTDPQYAETDVIPRLRPGSSGARRTTFSSTASQLMGDTERVSVRRRRMAVGTVVAAAVAVAGIAALTAGRAGAPPDQPVSLARPPETKLSAGAVQPAAPAPDGPPLRARGRPGPTPCGPAAGDGREPTWRPRRIRPPRPPPAWCRQAN